MFQVNKLFSVAGKTAVVTGGSRGIGLMIARAYVENGAKVYISSRKAEVCDAVAAELSKLGTCISVPADMTTEAGRKTLLQGVMDQDDAIDILVNNAGATWGAPFEKFPESGYDRILDLNLKALFFLTQDFLPLLCQNASQAEPARVINIGSIDGLRVSEMDTMVYGASKAALHHLTRNMAVKLGPKGVAVNAIAPGLFESKMTAGILQFAKPQIEKNCPLGRIGSPEDMAGVALMLASRAGAYVNGAVIPVDGGTWLRNL